VKKRILQFYSLKYFCKKYFFENFFDKKNFFGHFNFVLGKFQFLLILIKKFVSPDLSFDFKRFYLCILFLKKNCSKKI